MRYARLLKCFIMMLGMALHSIAALAQCHIVSHVVDIKTGETLPFASVYVDSEKNTITNEEGDFSLDVDSTDVIRFSYVGYQTLYVAADKVGETVQLARDGKVLDEVVVLGTELIIKKIRGEIKKTLREYDWKKTNFFYRQLGRANSQATSFIEAFFTSHSAVQTKDFSLGAGRFVQVASSQTLTPQNFFTFMQVTLYSKYHTKERNVPLCPNYKDYYTTECRRINDGEHPVYVVSFIPKDTTVWSVKAKVYADAETFKPLKYEGVGVNDWVENKIHDEKHVVPCDYKFVVHYQHDEDFIEVQSLHFDVRFSDNGKKYDVAGTMFNTGKRYIKGKGKLDFFDDLTMKIRDKGFDRKFWDDNEVVKRTPMENEALELFEGDNNFGVF